MQVVGLFAIAFAIIVFCSPDAEDFHVDLKEDNQMVLSCPSNITITQRFKFSVDNKTKASCKMSHAHTLECSTFAGAVIVFTKRDILLYINVSDRCSIKTFDCLYDQSILRFNVHVNDTATTAATAATAATEYPESKPKGLNDIEITAIALGVLVFIIIIVVVVLIRKGVISRACIYALVRRIRPHHEQYDLTQPTNRSRL